MSPGQYSAGLKITLSLRGFQKVSNSIWTAHKLALSSCLFAWILNCLNPILYLLESFKRPKVFHQLSNEFDEKFVPHIHFRGAYCTDVDDLCVHELYVLKRRSSHLMTCIDLLNTYTYKKVYFRTLRAKKATMIIGIREKIHISTFNSFLFQIMLC